MIGRRHAVYLSENDFPVRLLELGWTWDNEMTATKLLGIHIANEIVPGLM